VSQINWLETPAYIYVLLKDAGAEAVGIRDTLLSLPLDVRERIDRAYYHPYEKYAHVLLYGHEADAWSAVEGAVAPFCPSVLTDGEPPPGLYNEPWILVKAGGAPLKPVAQALNMTETPLNAMFGGPTPLASALSGGLIGAGLGYGGGFVADQVLPEKYFRKGRLRRVMALLGGAAGAAPGLAWGASASQSNPEAPGVAAFTHGWPMREQDRDEQFRKVGSVGEAHAALMVLAGEKAAKWNSTGAADFPPIEVDAFNQVVWGDHRTPLAVRAATTGLTESASVLTGADMVSPMDVGRIAVGMGTGWASGMLVGKTLGALAGLTPETQGKLQQAGMWAGILSNVVPMAFRRM
jgi:hypothetical protein